MLAAISLTLIQTASSAPVPVVEDAPPWLLLTGYDQCLRRELDRLLTDPITPEEVFDRSQAKCGFWLDAYVRKLTSNIVITNIDYAQEKARSVAKVRDSSIDYVRAQRRSLKAIPVVPNAPEK
ncbi:MAG: hypothetical protein V4808_04530 [Pseudomonadota bacterium]